MLTFYFVEMNHFLQLMKRNLERAGVVALKLCPHSTRYNLDYSIWKRLNCRKRRLHNRNLKYLRPGYSLTACRTEHTDLLSVSDLPADNFGYIVICRNCAHCFSVCVSIRYAFQFNWVLYTFFSEGIFSEGKSDTESKSVCSVCTGRKCMAES